MVIPTKYKAVDITKVEICLQAPSKQAHKLNNTDDSGKIIESDEIQKY